MLRTALCLLALGASGEGASAHALGQRYDLPLPLWLYLFGAASAVAGSFAFLAFFRTTSLSGRGPIVLYAGAIPNVWIAALRALSVALFGLIIAAGLFGNQNPLKNIAPVFVWVLWWVGFTFLSAFVVNLWPIVSPFAVIFEWADRCARLLLRRSLIIGRSSQWSFGAWPAFLFFWLFSWAELVAPAKDLPWAIAASVSAYAVLTWVGCAVFGPRVWLRNGEAFAVAFRLLGRFAPIHVVRMRRGWMWFLRPWAVGLLVKQTVPNSLIGFTLLMLATVSVDGFMETPFWAVVVEKLAPGLPTEVAPPRWPATALLAVAPALFAASYLSIIMLAATATRSRSATDLAGRFVFTLIPIAIAYHFAHYLSFILLAGQLAIPLASDPFGFGWDLLGTSLYRIDISIIDARTVWFVAVGAIVIGHIVATLLAHETALDFFRDARTARLSQVPMLFLMVSYTMLSLWILSQPIVETGR